MDGRAVRLSNPDKVYFPEKGYTKKDVADYFQAVGPGILRALRERPTTLQRFVDGVEGDFFYQKRAPKNLPDWTPTARIEFPSGLRRRRDVPHRTRSRPLGGEPGHPDLPPLAGAQGGHRPPRRTAHRPRPAARHGLRRCGEGGPRTARGPGRPRPARLAQDLRRPRHPRLRPARPRVDVHPGQTLGHRGGAGAGAPDARPGDHRLVEGGTRRADLRRLQPDGPRPDHRLRLLRTPLPARPRLRPAALGGDRRRRAPRLRPPDHAGCGTRRPHDLHADMDDHAFRLDGLLELARRDEHEHELGDLPYPPEYPKMPGEPKRVQPSRARRDDGDPA